MFSVVWWRRRRQQQPRPRNRLCVNAIRMYFNTVLFCRSFNIETSPRVLAYMQASFIQCIASISVYMQQWNVFFCLRSHQYTHHRHTGVNGNLLATVNEPYLFSSTFYGFDSSAKINCTEYFVHHDATQIGIISKIIFHRQLNRLNDICACTHNGTKECVASTFTNDVRL